MRWVTLIALTGCGRLNFDLDDARPGKDGRTFADAEYRDAAGTVAPDSPRPPDGGAAGCANFDLGSALGAVATGNTTGNPDSNQQCFGAGSPDVRYAWIAPTTARFTIDTCSGPDQSLDTALRVLDGSCTGTQLACDDDGCGTWLSRARVSLTAGQLVVIIVDGNADMGKYTLTITQN